MNECLTTPQQKTNILFDSHDVINCQKKNTNVYDVLISALTSNKFHYVNWGGLIRNSFHCI